MSDTIKVQNAEIYCNTEDCISCQTTGPHIFVVWVSPNGQQFVFLMLSNVIRVSVNRTRGRTDRGDIQDPRPTAPASCTGPAPKRRASRGPSNDIIVPSATLFAGLHRRADGRDTREIVDSLTRRRCFMASEQPELSLPTGHCPNLSNPDARVRHCNWTRRLDNYTQVLAAYWNM